MEYGRGLHYSLVRSLGQRPVFFSWYKMPAMVSPLVRCPVQRLPLRGFANAGKVQRDSSRHLSMAECLTSIILSPHPFGRILLLEAVPRIGRFQIHQLGRCLTRLRCHLLKQRRCHLSSLGGLVSRPRRSMRTLRSLLSRSTCLFSQDTGRICGSTRLNRPSSQRSG